MFGIFRPVVRLVVLWFSLVFYFNEFHAVPKYVNAQTMKKTVFAARYLLASGGRDRLVHLFDPVNNYIPLATVDDHTSALNSIIFHSVSVLCIVIYELCAVKRLLGSFRLTYICILRPLIFQSADGLELITCATDRLMVIRRLVESTVSFASYNRSSIFPV